MRIESPHETLDVNKTVFIVAELSANHGQDYSQAVDLIHAAKEAGANGIKLQTFTADTLTVNSDRPEFQIKGGLWDGWNLHKIYHAAHTPWEWHAGLQEEATNLGLHFFSTPFDPTAVEFLEELRIPVYKIASFELVDLPLIRRVAQTGKPLIMSTGMATLGEIELAVNTARDAGATDIALLKCTSSYPAPVSEANLRTIPSLRDTFNVVPGLSDHTLDITVPIIAVALGARIVEKHICLSRDSDELDAAFALVPEQFKAMVTAIRDAEAAFGTVHYGISANEESGKKYRRSLYVVRDVKAGETITRENVRSIRPANGLAPKYWDDIEGRTLCVDVAANTPLDWSMISS